MRQHQPPHIGFASQRGDLSRVAMPVFSHQAAMLSAKLHSWISRSVPRMNSVIGAIDRGVGHV